MANRRMFSKSITNSSNFLMMPQSAQALYLHLGMNADDDGFCEHFMVMRMTESKPDDLKILNAKGFVEVFDDKVLIIKDWKENNYIQADRYTPSKYLDVYKLNTSCIQDVYTTDTQDRLGKDRIGKDIYVPLRDTSPSNWKDIYGEQYINGFNKLFGSKYILTPKRKDKLKQRFKTFNSEQIEKALVNLSKSKFHQGQNDRGWKADPDFLIRSDEQVDNWLNNKGDKNERNKY